jgi:hypothetical protein
MAKPIKLSKEPKFVLGERKLDLLTRLKGYDIRPIYGPRDGNGLRPIAGCVVVDEKDFNVPAMEKCFE